MSNIIHFPYQGDDIRFNLEGWINATDIAKKFGKRPNDWLELPSTTEYMNALADALGLSVTRKSGNGLVIAKRGGKSQGTWLHPKMAVRFSQWLDVKFAVWCDLHIDSILRGHASPQQKYDHACIALTEQNRRGSLAGTELAKHRWHKPPIVQQVEYWRAQLQIPFDI